MEGRRFKRGGSEESENDSRKNYSISDAQPQPQVEIRWFTLWFLTNFNKKTWIWFMKQRQNLFYTHCVGLLLWKARMGGKPFHTWLKLIVFQQLDRAETDVNKMQSGYDWSGVVLRRSATLNCREWPKNEVKDTSGGNELPLSEFTRCDDCGVNLATSSEHVQENPPVWHITCLPF